MHGVQSEDFEIYQKILECVKYSEFTVLLKGSGFKKDEIKPEKWLVYKNESHDKKGDALHDGGSESIAVFFQVEIPSEKQIYDELARKKEALSKYEQSELWALSEAEKLNKGVLPKHFTAKAISDRVEIESDKVASFLKPILKELGLNPFHGFSFQKDSKDERLFWDKFLPIAKSRCNNSNKPKLK